MEINITKNNIKDYLDGSLPLVIDFWAPWCAPCRRLVPIVEELASEYDGKVVIGKCNIDEQGELADEFGIRSIPTLLFFKEGTLADKMVGARMKSELQEKINTLY